MQDIPSVIEVTTFDVVIYDNGRPEERDKDVWFCRTSCTVHLWTEKHVGSKTLKKERRICVLDEHFFKITFLGSFTERQVSQKELALYMCCVKTLQCVDEMTTCTDSNSDSAFIVDVPCTTEPRILDVVPEKE